MSKAYFNRNLENTLYNFNNLNIKLSFMKIEYLISRICNTVIDYVII